MLRNLVSRCSRPFAPTWAIAPWQPRRRRSDNPLSPRERDVLRLVAKGMPSKQIERKLALSERLSSPT